MTNVVSLHGSKASMVPETTLADFVDELDLDQLTVQGEKARVKVWKDIALNSLHLTTLATDPLSVHGDKIYFASTFEGAAALCTQILVHDIPELSAFGTTLYDGHMLYVSLVEFNARINNKNACIQWLRDGCGANAALALGMDYSTQWTAVDTESVRKILHSPEMSLIWWDADRQCDAYRYFSAITDLCAPLECDITCVQSCELNKGSTNEEWQSVLNAWNAFHKSREWNMRLTKKAGINGAARLLGEMLNTVYQENMEERFVQLVLRTFAPNLDDDEAVQIAPVVAKILNTKSQIMRLVDGLVAVTKPLEIAHELQSTNIWKTSLTYAWYGRFLDTKDPRDQSVAMAAFVPLSKKDLFCLLLNQIDRSNFTHEQLQVLSQTEPHVIQWDQYTTVDDGTVVSNLLTDYKYLLAARDDCDGFTPSNRMQTIIDLIRNGWLGFNADFKNIQVQEMWVNVFTMISQEYSDDPQVTLKLPTLLQVTQSQSPHFVSYLFISLLRHENFSSVMTPSITQMLFDAGADWNIGLYEKTLAEEVLECAHMPLPLKIQARRSIQNHNRNKSIVQLV